MKMCNMDCLNCIHPDCINDDLPTEAEIKAQDEYDRDINTDELRMQAIDKGKISQWLYIHSPKGKEAQKRYNQSEKGKAAQKRYSQSEKGKEAQRRQTQKKIASGKNAEYCRRYAMRKKGLAV